MQRTMPERNLKIVELPTDAQKYMMRFLAPADLIHLHAANRHFRKLVKAYLSDNPNIKKTIQEYQSRYRHHLFTVKTDRLNDYIEDEMDNLPANPLRHIIACIAGAVTCVSIGLMTNELTITRNTLFSIGALLLAIAVVIGGKYTLIDRRINHAYRQINQLNDMEAGRAPRLR